MNASPNGGWIIVRISQESNGSIEILSEGGEAARMRRWRKKAVSSFAFFLSLFFLFFSYLGGRPGPVLVSFPLRASSECGIEEKQEKNLATERIFLNHNSFDFPPSSSREEEPAYYLRQ